MKYNHQIHHRRSIRLQGYDYSQAGAYFITICCHKKELRFGTIEDAGLNNSEAQLVLNDFGQVAYNEWLGLPDRFPNVELDIFQIMPNHMHGIIILGENIIRGTPKNVGATLAVAQHTGIEITGESNGAGASPAPTAGNKNAAIGDIAGAYKSLVANECLDLFKHSIEIGIAPEYEKMGKLWQRNYHEHIIRDERSYRNISNYILNNPAKWKEDKFFKER